MGRGYLSNVTWIQTCPPLSSSLPSLDASLCFWVPSNTFSHLHYSDWLSNSPTRISSTVGLDRVAETGSTPLHLRPRDVECKTMCLEWQPCEGFRRYVSKRGCGACQVQCVHTVCVHSLTHVWLSHLPLWYFSYKWFIMPLPGHSHGKH